MPLSKQQIIDKTLKISGFPKLNPMQESAIKKGLLDKKNLVVAAPTASGKTLLCELAGINTFLNKRRKMIYLGPLVALVSEKYQSFKKKYSSSIRVAMSVGDYDSSDHWLADYDWVLMSNEKCDSLIRHGASWIKEVGLIVVDEIHMLHDPSRGPTLEVTLTRLREILPHAQILALSATINNAKELGEWLNAEVILSNYRPLELHEGVYLDSRIQFLEKDNYNLNEDLTPEQAIFDNTTRMKKQALFFVATRRSTESLAERLGKFNRKNLGKNEREHLEKLSQEIEKILEVPTRQCKKISACIRNGIAFHHAGLLYKQKQLIEENFRNGLIKGIVATPTLAYGINTPAFRVIVRDVKRYYAGYGSRFIPVLEYKQFSGRAGRPDFGDTFGESILVAKSEDEAQQLIDNYILGEPEEITSKLALEPVLRMHTLALIASGFVNTHDSLLKFFSKTFYSYQYQDLSRIDMKLGNILDMLIKFKFITRKEKKILPTRIGKRVSELYIDPLTAHHFIVCMKKAMRSRPNSFSYLHVMSNTLEMRPLVAIRSKQFEEINGLMIKHEGKFLTEVPEEWDLDYDDFLKSVNTAWMFERWTEESTEDEILSKFRVTPGDLRSRLTNADWLLYAMNELALLLEYKKILKDIRKLRVRMKYGVKEELVPLVRLRQVGRVRARRLYRHNLRSLSNLRKIPLRSLEKIVGPKIAAIIKKQLGENVEEVKDEKQLTLKG